MALLPPPNPEEPNAGGAEGAPNADGADPPAKPKAVAPNFEVVLTFSKAPKPCVGAIEVELEGEDGVCPKAEMGCDWLEGGRDASFGEARGDIRGDDIPDSSMLILCCVIGRVDMEEAPVALAVAIPG